MTASLRVLGHDDRDQWYGAVERAFGGVPMAAERRALRGALTEDRRSLGAWDGGECVGTASSYAFRISVPGGALVPAAGVALVGVVPTHRRRGLLTAMMRRQLDDIRARNEPLALLTASEPAAYGRFGYGIATRQLCVEIDTVRAAVEPPEGTELIRLRQADPADGAVLARCEAVYAALVRERPGMLARRPGWERWGLLDPPSARGGGSPLQCVLAERDGETVGWARYRTAPSWSHAGPTGTVTVTEIHARDAAASAALWRFLCGIDLMAGVHAFNLPVDDPVLHLVPDPRRCEPRLRDGAHLRLVEVGGALAARAYRVPVDVVLEVTDAFCPWNEGRWRLSGGPGGAVCERTADPADLALDVRDLASVHLGGVPVRELARAGRVRELSPGAVSAASLAFGSEVVPWLPHNF
ncbi:GNAT family N-acetyltransferase [Streptomyces sp. CAU 1734]|uniref:GNAT family N-acetyltransferase n=1 Tax=Streptomyces sp. CAU 1734 TaxID=3140360 RepID=UPI003261C590